MEPPIFELCCAPSASDIDELGHVSNLVYVRWILEAARAHSRAVGLGSDDYQRLGAVFVVRRYEIDYLSPVKLGERVRVRTWVESWKGVSSLRRTAMVRHADGAEVVRAATTWVFVGWTDGKPRRIPVEVSAAFAANVSASV